MMTNNQCIPLFNALILLTSRVQFMVLLSAHQDPLLLWTKIFKLHATFATCCFITIILVVDLQLSFNSPGYIPD
ncbi:hypothetical protein BCR33DRAFT_300326 [Rhizoclosmatium globosum]|uniref:Uncharacterized protein n=1 Tax=Rhizoclosmatium globosum TaxID=329046 RepID=A0A1Y2C6F1_9FUNG|nr:hypothetical protein BCR33DRAFT_300326 [Rhizoclosmatium globosum]|eukprot:ORY42622.1 hypothetical protein BCR33DRAFT_300326 [Rhizoclosmatium globosum]